LDTHELIGVLGKIKFITAAFQIYIHQHSIYAALTLALRDIAFGNVVYAGNVGGNK
jgi:hypothetical protein